MRTFLPCTLCHYSSNFIILVQRSTIGLLISVKILNPFCNIYYILPIDVNAFATLFVVITTFCPVTTNRVTT